MISKCTNCKKYIYYFLEGALALLIIIGLTLKMTTKEDTWLCENGRWIKHGNPSAEMPKTGCGELKEDKVVTNFLECEAAGYPVMKSYPRQCQVKDMIFVEEVGITDEAEKSKANLVKLESVHAGDSITSPISIVNWDGLIIGQGVAQAKGEWMTEGFVPFEANISFDKATYKNNGSIILQKDNPSGLPENDDALEIPIFFK